MDQRFTYPSGDVPGRSGDIACPERHCRQVQGSTGPDYGKLPLSFELNQGQSDNQVRFLSRGPSYSVFLTPAEAVLALHASEVTEQGQSPRRTTKNSSDREPLSLAVQAQTRPFLSKETIGESRNIEQETQPRSMLRIQLVGANPNPQISGVDKLPGKVNYFRGNKPNQWRTNIPTYATVKYENVYPGIDLVYYGNQRQHAH